VTNWADAEEVIAQDFANWYVKNEEGRSKANRFIRASIRRIYQKLAGFLEKFFKTSKQDILTELYKDIASPLSSSKIVRAKTAIPKQSEGEKFQKQETERPSVTTTILSKLEGKTTVSKQFISDLTNSADIKQVEKELIRTALESEGPKVNVEEFTAKVEAQLLPLTVESSIDGTPRYENVTLPDKLKGRVEDYFEHVFSSSVKTSAGGVHFGEDATNYFGHTRIEDMEDGETRRIIEVQSDLYQKGNLERELSQYNESSATIEQINENIDRVNKRALKLEKDGYIELAENEKANLVGLEHEKQRRTQILREEENKLKLQQYNDPTAHFRMIREEMKMAAQDGKTTLLFPTGKTAMSIEGLGQSSSWVTENGILKPEELEVGKVIYQNQRDVEDEMSWLITQVSTDGKFKAVPNRQLEFENEQGIYKIAWDRGYIDRDTGDWNMEKAIADPDVMKIISNSYLSESFDISGKVDTSNPIYKFYEKDIQKYLKRLSPETRQITDERGVTWFEVPVDPTLAEKAVPAFQTQDQIDEEGPANFTDMKVDADAFYKQMLQGLFEEFKANRAGEEMMTAEQIDQTQILVDAAKEQIAYGPFGEGEAQARYEAFRNLVSSKPRYFEAQDFQQFVDMLVGKTLKVGNQTVEFRNKNDVNKMFVGDISDEMGMNDNEFFDALKEAYEKDTALRAKVKALTAELKTLKEPAKRQAAFEKGVEAIIDLSTIRPTKSLKGVIRDLLRPEKNKTVEIGEYDLLKMRFKAQRDAIRMAKKSIQNEIADKFRVQNAETRAKQQEANRQRKAEIRAEGKDALAEERVSNEARKKELQEIKDSVAMYAKLLPLSERGKLLDVVKNAKTRGDLAKAYARINRRVEATERRGLIDAIKKQYEKALGSPSVDVGYKARISGLLSDILLEGKSEKTMARIMALRDYVARAHAKGEKVFIPSKILDLISMIGRRDIKTMPVVDLQNILEDLERLNKMGRLKQELKEGVWANKVEQARATVIPELIPIGHKEYQKLLPGEQTEELTAFQEVARSIKRTRLYLGKGVRTMDVFFDMFSGGKGLYQTNFFKTFKAPIDSAFQAYLDRWDALNEPVLALWKELNLSNEQLENIGIYAQLQQEGGADKLLQLKFSQDALASVKLNADEMRFYELLRTQFDTLFPVIQEYMARVHNLDVKGVADYFPMITDFDSMNEADFLSRFGDNVDANGRPKKNFRDGSTITRVENARQNIRLNAMEVYLKHMDNVSYMLEMGETIKFLSEVKGDQSFKDAIGSYGDIILTQWLDILARKGGSEGAKQIHWLDTLRKNLSVGTMGIKLSSIIIQPSAFFDGASMIGGQYATWGATKMIDPEARLFAFDNMPELRKRMGDDPAFREFREMQSDTKLGKMRDAWGSLAMSPIQAVDTYTATSIVLGAYKKYIDENGLVLDFANPNEAALQYAQLVLRKTQGSAYFKDSPLALTRGAITTSVSLDKLLFQFQSFVLNRWNYLSYDLPETLRRDPKRGINAITWLAMSSSWAVAAPMFARSLLRAIFGGGDDEDPFLNQLTSEILGSVPFVSQYFSAIEYGSVPVPIISAAEKVIGGTQSATQGKRADTRAKGAVRALSGLGSFFGIAGAKISSH